MRTTIAIALALALGVSALGCGKKSGDSTAAKAESPLDQVSSAFQGAGLKSELAAAPDATKFHAAKCMTGSVEQVDTVVCEYASADAVAQGKTDGDAWIADATTGAVLDNGRALLAVADRKHVDPNGKAIHKITQAFIKSRL
jgi:hypothetical protein